MAKPLVLYSSGICVSARRAGVANAINNATLEWQASLVERFIGYSILTRPGRKYSIAERKHVLVCRMPSVNARLVKRKRTPTKKTLFVSRKLGSVRTSRPLNRLPLQFLQFFLEQRANPMLG